MRRKMMTCNFHLSFVFDTIYTTSKRRQQWFGFFSRRWPGPRPGVCERAMYRFGDISYEI